MQGDAVPGGCIQSSRKERRIRHLCRSKQYLCLYYHPLLQSIDSINPKDRLLQMLIMQHERLHFTSDMHQCANTQKAEAL